MGKPAARMGDMHLCPMVTPGVPPVPHVGGPVMKGSLNVFIGGRPAATVGDMCTCVGPPDTIVQGSMSVLINGKPAARMGDMTSHGGRITLGEFTVLIGDVGSGGTVVLPPAFASHLTNTDPKTVKQLEVLTKAAQLGTPLAEMC